jgi:flagellar hook-associated protein 1 FlgK
MSISSAMNNAVSGMTATARMAEVVSSNLSNALTDSYGRRSVDLSAAQIGGVRIDGITRYSDPGLVADRRLADAALGGNQRQAQSLMRLESAIGGVDSPTNLAARLAAFENALISAASDPAAENRLTAVVTRLDDLASALRDATRSTQTQRQEADAAIARDVDRLNTALVQVADLNKDVLRLRAAGQDTAAAMDARQQIIDEISSIVPTREIMRDNGTVALMTVSGTTLLDGRPLTIGFTPTPTITADMAYPGALSALTFPGQVFDAGNGAGRLGGGTLGAAFALRDQTLPSVQAGLDTIAADLVARLQDPANDPSITPGALGLLTDEGQPYDPADIIGLAGRLVLNPLIDPQQGGDAWRLRDGLGAATPGQSGNATQLDRWRGALAAPRADAPGTPPQSAIGRIASFTADLGAKRLVAETQQSFAAARWDGLRAAELSQGVDTDYELQMLLRVEKAYAANAKVIQTINALMQRLMEI